MTWAQWMELARLVATVALTLLVREAAGLLWRLVRRPKPAPSAPAAPRCTDQTVVMRAADPAYHWPADPASRVPTPRTRSPR